MPADTPGTRYFFTIPIGDWSSDGHGKCDTYRASAAKPIEAIREAFFAAKEKLPDLDPGSFCKQYRDHTLPPRIAEVLTSLGVVFDPEWMDQENMAKYIAWFLNQGDPELDARIEPTEDSLIFYGVDARGRHIGHLGYGLFD